MMRIVFTTAALLAMASAAADGVLTEFPRTADGHPDLSGVWQALNTAQKNAGSASGVSTAGVGSAGSWSGTDEPGSATSARGGSSPSDRAALPKTNTSTTATATTHRRRHHGGLAGAPGWPHPGGLGAAWADQAAPSQ